jgi:hypothetical protein
MDKNKLKELGAAWKTLNTTYDDQILELIDDPTPLTPERIEALKQMQEELFNLEVELFKALQEG